MSQTNFTPISIYYSTTAAAVPTAANLVPGELAINTADGKLYYEDSSGVVQVLATKSTGSIGGSNTQVQFNNSGSLGGSSSFTWDGTTVTATKFAGALNGTVGATTASTGAFTTLSATGVATFSAGTVSLPAITTTGDTNTGIYFPAADTIAFTEGGTESMRIDSSGNCIVGGNTNAGNARLLSENASGNQLGLRYSGIATWYNSIDSSGNYIWNKDGTEYLRISSTGNVGIGTSSPSAPLTVYTSTATTLNVDIKNAKATGQGDTYLNLYKAPNGYSNGVAFYTGTTLKWSIGTGITAIDDLFKIYNATTGASAITIDASSNVGIGTSSPTALLHAYISSSAELKFQNSSQNNLYVSGTNATVVVDATGSNYPGFIVKTQGVTNGQIGGSGSTASGMSITNSAGNGLRINSNGDGQFSDSISVGDATPATSGSGITFPATQSASTDANTLDDYEEGTWTPNLGGTATYTAQTGNYVKIGKQVTVIFDMTVLLLGTGSTTLISGLPFQAANINNGGAVGYFSNLAVNVVSITCAAEGNNTRVAFNSLGAAGGTATNNPAIFGNSTRIIGTVTYFI